MSRKVLLMKTRTVFQLSAIELAPSASRRPASAMGCETLFT
jgi:hypothetical protein